MFTQKEIKHLIISILLLGFVFGFNDGNKSFIANLWVLNFIRITLLVAITILFRELIIKLYAKRKGATSEYNSWFIQRVWFTQPKLKPGIPFGYIFSILGAAISNGKFFFTAMGIHDLKENRNARVGRKTILLTYFEECLIILSGVYANLFLIFLSVFLMNNYDINLNAFIDINFFLIFWNLILPISDLDGAKIFFGSKLLWIFSVLFVVLSYLFLNVGIILALFGALLISFVGVYFYYTKYGN